MGTSAAGTFLTVKDGKFVDDRWVGGRWDLNNFKGRGGEVDWDKVRQEGVVRVGAWEERERGGEEQQLLPVPVSLSMEVAWQWTGA